MRYSIVSYSKLFEHSDFRWDSEFLCFEPYRNEKLEYISIKKIIKNTQYGISINMNEDGIGYPIYRMNEIHNMVCDSNVYKNADILNEEAKAFILNDGDVLFNRTNSQKFVGRTGVYYKRRHYDDIFASYLVRLVPNEEIMSSEYLTTFLNCKYGVEDIKRRARESINQSNVNPEELKKVKIPILVKLDKLIEKCFKKSYALSMRGEEIHKQTETLLLNELGLVDYTPPHTLTYEKKLSDIHTAERLDAEYFQPKYDYIEHKLKNNFECYEIGKYPYFDINTGQYTSKYVSEEDGKPYIRGTDIKNGNIDIYSLVYISCHEQEKERIACEGDVVVTRVGTIGVAGRIPIECVGGTYSDNLIRIRINDSSKLNSYYLTLYLNSILGTSLMIRSGRGSVQQRLNQETLKEIIVPIPQINKQEEIADLIIESNKKAKIAKSLLDIAKQSVELAIEQNEDIAIEWIKSQTKELGVTLDG